MSPLTPNSGNTSTLTPNSGHNKVSPPPQRPISAPAAAQLGTPPKQEHNTSSSLQSLLLDSNALQSAMLNKNCEFLMRLYYLVEENTDFVEF